MEKSVEVKPPRISEGTMKEMAKFFMSISVSQESWMKEEKIAS
ncbi:hypothetical protein [Bacillus sp. JJ1764]